MPFPMFDRSCVQRRLIAERIHDLGLSAMKPAVADNDYAHAINLSAGRSIRSGAAPFKIAMMKAVSIIHFTMTGAATQEAVLSLYHEQWEA